jgi:hypothetical protein
LKEDKVKEKETSRSAHSCVPTKFFFLYTADLENGRQECPTCGAEGLELDVLDLAKALSISPAWEEMPKAALVVRLRPRPALGVVGRFDAEAEERLMTLGPQLARALACVRYVSYSQAEEDCERLANLLIERFGREELRRFRFAAVPRGGFIVLGMLAYALGLEHTQLEPPYPPDAPLVVVDDCAISGRRFGHFLARCESRQIVFAHLYSHPDLRTAIEAREPRVVACMGAQDLYDHAPARYGEEYPAWRERWLERLGKSGYWLGSPGLVCFPWNEPDSSVWNSVTERVEGGWRIIPPELCLKNRPASGTKPIPVQVQPEGQTTLRPSTPVLFGEFEEHVVVGNIETKESFTLTGVAADIWRAVVKHGDLDDVVVSLSETYEVDPAILQADVRDFLEDLSARDLLERNYE